MFSLKNVTMLTRAQQKNVKGGDSTCSTGPTGICIGSSKCVWHETLMSCAEGIQPSHNDMSVTIR